MKRIRKAAPQSVRRVYRFSLFVSGATSKSVRAITNIKAICDKHLSGKYQIEVVDIYQQPERLSKDQVVAHYAEVSGRQVDDIDYYVILAKWKLAIVLERGFQRAGDDEKLRAFGPVVVDLMRSAAELADTTDYGR